MWTYKNTDELYHYGIPGMKWGVRRSSKYVTGRQATKNAKKAYKKAYLDSANKSGAKVASGKLGIAAKFPNTKDKWKAKSAGKKAAKESFKRDKQYNEKIMGKGKTISEKTVNNIKNMPMSEAKKMINRQRVATVASTATIMIGGLTLAKVYKNK